MFTILPTSFDLSATFLPVSVAIRIQAFLDKIPNLDVKFVIAIPNDDAIKIPYKILHIYKVFLFSKIAFIVNNIKIANYFFMCFYINIQMKGL